MNLLELASAIGVDGFLHCEELQKLVELACNRDVLEIGSYRGLSAWGMALTAKTLTCVDTFSAATNGQDQRENRTTYRDFLRATDRYNDRHVLHYVGTSRQASVDLEGQYDLIFVDGAHDFAGVKQDIELWAPKLRAGGVWAFHDYGSSDYPGVKQAVDERFGTVDMRIYPSGVMFGLDADVCVTLCVVKSAT